MGTAFKAVGVWGVGSATPDKTLTNQDLVAMGLDTTDEWIQSRTGIKERHVVEEGTATSDLCTEAGLKACKAAGITPADLDLIIVATATPDYLLFPSTACIVQHKMGCRQIPAFDLSAACTGFVYAVTTAQQFIQCGTYQRVLVIGADVLSRWVNWKDRSICVLFGDGAGAVVLGPVKEGYGILASELFADGEGGDMLCTPAGGTREPINNQIINDSRHTIFMDGKAVFKFATQVIQETTRQVLNKAGLSVADIRLFIPHQANARITRYAEEKLGFKPEQVASNIQKYGNTSAASIPLALDEYKAQLKDGDVVFQIGFGAGLTWGANVIKWGGRL